jgi:hypothetical protein
MLKDFMVSDVMLLPAEFTQTQTGLFDKYELAIASRSQLITVPIIAPDTQTKVNVQEFRSQHREVFTLGQHPKEFFIQRFGANHFRLIGTSYFVFVDGCWVAVDVAGFVFSERVICEGDPDFIVVY